MRNKKIWGLVLLFISVNLFASSPTRASFIMEHMADLNADHRYMSEISCSKAAQEIEQWQPATTKQIKETISALVLLNNVCHLRFDRRQEHSYMVAILQRREIPYMDLPSTTCIKKLFVWRQKLMDDRTQLVKYGVSEHRIRSILMKYTAETLHVCKPWISVSQISFMNRILRNGYN